MRCPPIVPDKPDTRQNQCVRSLRDTIRLKCHLMIANSPHPPWPRSSPRRRPPTPPRPQSAMYRRRTNCEPRRRPLGHRTRSRMTYHKRNNQPEAHIGGGIHRDRQTQISTLETTYTHIDIKGPLNKHCGIAVVMVFDSLEDAVGDGRLVVALTPCASRTYPYVHMLHTQPAGPFASLSACRATAFGGCLGGRWGGRRGLTGEARLLDVRLDLDVQGIKVCHTQAVVSQKKHETRRHCGQRGHVTGRGTVGS